MQQGHAAQLPLLGGATAWSLLDLNPRMKRLHSICRARGDLEVTASAFAEVTVSSIFEIINQRRTRNGQEAIQFDFVSQQPPERHSKRRIDFQVVGWTSAVVQHESRMFNIHNPFVFAHVEVKRHDARPNEVETLESQIITAFEATEQNTVYGIAFHGTAMRVWRWASKVLHALTGNDSDDVEDKTNWIDAEERGTPSVAMLGAFLAMVENSPYPLVAKSAMPMQMPNKQVWDLAEGLFVELDNKVPIPRSVLATGETVVIGGERFRLPSAAVDSFKRTVIDHRRPDWKQLANAYSISNPTAYKHFERARKLAKEGEHRKAREVAARAFMAISSAQTGPSRGIAAGPSRGVARPSRGIAAGSSPGNVAGPSRGANFGPSRTYRAQPPGEDQGDPESGEESDEDSDEDSDEGSGN